MEFFSSQFTIGIIGGGQLGKMMLAETQKLDIRTIVLDPAADAPAKIGCDIFFQGDLMDFDAVYNFGKKAHVVTIEIEHVNTAALARLEMEGVAVYPSATTLALIQDKGSQKQFFAKNNIPTAPFTIYEKLSTLQEAVKHGRQILPFVWKSTRFGYDGQGVKIVRQLSDLDQLQGGMCLVEELVPFSMELAVLVARNTKGEKAIYPVVEMEFHPEANQVEYVICPARVSDEIARKAVHVAEKVADDFQQVGLLAVELFLTNNNEILVNEVAPRPHNSGHYSIEAAYTSQFEQHIRAIVGLPLGSTRSKASAVMVNLVGAAGFSGDVVYSGIDEIMHIPGVTPHIYGKKQTRPFRKMGHITVVNESVAEARRIAETVKSTIQVIS